MAPSKVFQASSIRSILSQPVPSSEGSRTQDEVIRGLEKRARSLRRCPLADKKATHREFKNEFEQRGVEALELPPAHFPSGELALEEDDLIREDDEEFRFAPAMPVDIVVLNPLMVVKGRRRKAVLQIPHRLLLVGHPR